MYVFWVVNVVLISTTTTTAPGMTSVSDIKIAFDLLSYPRSLQYAKLRNASHVYKINVYTFCCTQTLGRCIKPTSRAITKSRIKTKKRTRPIPAAAAAIPVNPNRAAMIAITKKITAHLNMVCSFLHFACGLPSGGVWQSVQQGGHAD